MLKKYTKGSWPSLVTIETMRKLALHSDPFRDAPLARYLGFKCKVCPTINETSCLTWHQSTAVVN